MNMDQSAIWLAGSILFSLGFIVLIATAVVVNNILHKYWKPVQFFKWAEYPPRYATEEELAKIIPQPNKPQ
jgi:hypothetical protein